MESWRQITFLCSLQSYHKSFLPSLRFPLNTVCFRFHLAGNSLHRSRIHAHSLSRKLESHPWYLVSKFLPSVCQQSVIAFTKLRKYKFKSSQFSLGDLSSPISCKPSREDSGRRGVLRNLSPGSGYWHSRSFLLQPQHAGFSLVYLIVACTHLLHYATFKVGAPNSFDDFGSKFFFSSSSFAPVWLLYFGSPKEPGA
jgi:hypothetical protein